MHFDVDPEDRLPMPPFRDNPRHPGLIVRVLLDEMSVSIGAAAEALGVSRQRLHNLIAGRAGVSAEMALRLEISLGSTADFWMRMQQQYDLAQLQKRRSQMRARSSRSPEPQTPATIKPKADWTALRGE